MHNLFESARIGGLVLNNRFVRSATWEGLATEDGACTPELTNMMVRLAEGEVGLIITGHAYVERRGQASPRQLGLYEDSLIPELYSMTEAVHARGGKMAAQLAHSGLWANAQLTGRQPVAPSALLDLGDPSLRQADHQDLETITDAFAAAAERAQKAGFDAVQLHSAHGYLLSQFLSPYFNRRTDRYGGNLQNRIRIHREIISAVRSRIGNEYPLLIKMNGADFLDGGLMVEEAVEAAKILSRDGLDGIEISGGSGLSGKLGPIRTGIRNADQEAYFRDAAAAVRKAVDKPVILVGGIRSMDTAEEIIETGTADFISMSRPFIREPDLVQRWRSGNRAPAACLSDSRCFVPARSGEGLRCVMKNR